MRAIDKYDLYDNYVKTYNTQQEILKDLEKEFGFKNLTNSNLSLCLNKKRKTAYGYKWYWNDEVLEKKETIKKPTRVNRFVNFDIEDPAELFYEICRNLK